MKLHRPLCLALQHGLEEIFTHRKLADRVVENLLQSDKRWGARDRAFVAENLYGMVRYWRKLCELTQQPYTATDNNYWHIMGAWFWLQNTPLPDWPEWATLSAATLAERAATLQNNRAIEAAVPDWLDAWGSDQFQESWPAELAALNIPADVFLRVNTQRTDLPTLQAKLAQEGIQTEVVATVPTALQLVGRKNLKNNPLYQQGFFEVQDAGSQLIAPFLGIIPDSKVIDACAGAGGKTLQLANLLENKGELVAFDVEERKLKELQLRAKRNGAMGIKTRVVTPNVVAEYANWADFLLLDVPCSGLGVLRRNPDAKWRITPEFIANIKTIQAQILNDYSQMVRVGGKLVYATCSILSGENEEQVKHFLATNPHFTLEEEAWLTPAKHGFDGFYMARLRRERL